MKYLMYHLLFKFVPLNKQQLQLTPIASSIPLFLDYLYSSPNDLDNRIIMFKLQHNNYFQQLYYPDEYQVQPKEGGDWEAMIAREIALFEASFYKPTYELFNQLKKNQLDIYVEDFLE